MLGNILGSEFIRINGKGRRAGNDCCRMNFPELVSFSGGASVVGLVGKLLAVVKILTLPLASISSSLELRSSSKLEAKSLQQSHSVYLDLAWAS